MIIRMLGLEGLVALMRLAEAEETVSMDPADQRAGPISTSAHDNDRR